MTIDKANGGYLRSRSDRIHEQVTKLVPVSRAAGMDCECPLYCIIFMPDSEVSRG